MTDGTSPLYVENENERSCLLQQDMVDSCLIGVSADSCPAGAP